MKKNSPHYNALESWLGEATKWEHLTHLKTCIWMIMALTYTSSVNLTKWTVYMPCRGQFAQSKQRRMQRWLNNPRINVHRIYGSLITAALANWQEEVMYLAFDTSLFWEEYCLIRLCVVHRGRALPLVWRVRKHKSASVSFSAYQEMLEQATGRLPKGVKIVLLADRGFVHTRLMQMCTEKWGWHYRIRVKSNCWIWRGKKDWCQLKDFHLNRGDAICLQGVRLHKGDNYGPVNVILGRNNINGEFWAVVSDEKTTLHTFQEYGLRFDIEENFLDDQSSGWNLQRSEIRDVCALSRLCFIMAVATIFATAQGLAVVDGGHRRWVDTHWFRGNSYFRIGCDWIKAAVLHAWNLIHQVCFSSNFDSAPSMASRPQHRQRLHRLEFTIHSYHYLSA